MSSVMALNVGSLRCLNLSGVGGRPGSSDIAKTALMTSEQSSGKIHAILQLG